MYNDVISSIIIAFKYKRIEWLRNWICNEMVKSFKNYPEFEDYNYITYIPIGFLKKIKRGFNQTEIMAEDISKNLNLFILKGILRKTKFFSKSQVGLDYEGRKRNVEDLFKLTDYKMVKNKKIIVIDDVATTMSTLNEVAGVLKEGGAKSVCCFTLARE